MRRCAHAPTYVNAHAHFSMHQVDSHDASTLFCVLCSKVTCARRERERLKEEFRAQEERARILASQGVFHSVSECTRLCAYDKLVATYKQLKPSVERASTCLISRNVRLQTFFCIYSCRYTQALMLRTSLGCPTKSAAKTRQQIKCQMRTWYHKYHILDPMHTQGVAYLKSRLTTQYSTMLRVVFAIGNDWLFSDIFLYCSFP